LSTALTRSTHDRLLLAVPAGRVGVRIGRPGPGRSPRVQALARAGFAGGSLIFLYLPLRSLANPLPDWGDPETLTRLWDHVRRAQYESTGSGVGPLVLSADFEFSGWKGFLARALTQVKNVAQIFLDREYTWAAGVVGLTGACALWVNMRKWFWGTLLVIICTAYGYAFSTNFDMSRAGTDFMPFLPGLLIFLIWVAWGFESLGRGFNLLSARLGRRGTAGVSALAAFGFAALMLFTNFPACDLSRHHYARWFGEEILKALKPGALFFATNDDAYFVSMYLMDAEGLRPDVRLVGTSRLNQGDYPEQLRGQFPDIQFPPKADAEPLYQKFDIPGRRNRQKGFNAALGRAIARENFDSSPVYWDLGSEKMGDEVALLRRGFIYELKPPERVTQDERDKTEGESDRYWGEFEKSVFQDPAFLAEPPARHAMALRYNNYGLELEQWDKREKAKGQYEKALALYPELPQPYYNLGNFYAGQGRAEEAKRNYELALEYKPDYGAAHLGLGNMYLDRGEVLAAIKEYQSAIRASPALIPAYSNLATVYARSGRLQEAIHLYKLALRIDPTAARIHYNLALVLEKAKDWDHAALSLEYVVGKMPDSAEAHVKLGEAYAALGRREDARRAWEKALEIDPTLDSVREKLEEFGAGKEPF
ncbi:MAG: tetratricopeptide repeat protein, partial [Candidatus Omnitrophica bacterium]|nr:tetratricopeptide repeat protein [Candidatus Omnitrophota bacterium]